MKLVKPYGRKSLEKGFSLIELMVVVAIIGILSALAVPRFRVFQAKARQAEAKNNLSHVYTLQQSFYADNDKYGDFGGEALGFDGGAGNCGENELGFVLRPCSKVRYTYTMSNVSASTFLANAKTGTNDDNRVLPGCTQADEWTIDEEKELLNINDVTKNCGDD